MTRKNTILFTGLIRDEDKFLFKLEQAHNLLSSGLVSKVVFSTWVDEVEKYDKVKKYIEEKRITTIVTDEPNLKIQGHIFHQMKALSYGLQLCEEDSFVYKMRPDLGEFDDNVIEILNGNYEAEVDTSGNWPQFFKSRVVIETAILHHPFYINDIQFYGRKSDVNKLINFDLYFEVHYSKLSPEQFFFYKNFHGIEIFKEFFKIYNGIDHSDDNSNIRSFELLFESSFYQKVVVIYWIILNKYFYFKKTKEINLAKDNKFTYYDLIGGGIKGFMKLSKSISIPVVNSQHFITALKGSGDGEILNILKKYERIRSNFHETYMNESDSESLRCFSEKSADLFNLNSRKDIRKKSEYQYIICGPNMRVTSVNKNNYTKQLEVQVNNMKRKIQRLNGNKL